MLMRDRRKCAKPGCDREFIPRSSRNRFCLMHRKTEPVDRLTAPSRRILRAQSPGDLINHGSVTIILDT